MFDTHKLNEQGFDKMASFKSVMAGAIRTVIKEMPDGREKSIFITKMEEGIFFGAKAIASIPENHSDRTEY